MPNSQRAEFLNQTSRLQQAVNEPEFELFLHLIKQGELSYLVDLLTQEEMAAFNVLASSLMQNFEELYFTLKIGLEARTQQRGLSLEEVKEAMKQSEVFYDAKIATTVVNVLSRFLGKKGNLYLVNISQIKNPRHLFLTREFINYVENSNSIQELQSKIGLQLFGVGDVGFQMLKQALVELDTDAAD